MATAEVFIPHVVWRACEERVDFMAVVGFTDCRFSERDGKPCVEFSWQGHDDSDDTCGRGWAIIKDDGKMHGRIFIHCGDDSTFNAKRAPTEIARDRGFRAAPPIKQRP